LLRIRERVEMRVKFRDKLHCISRIRPLFNDGDRHLRISHFSDGECNRQKRQIHEKKSAPVCEMNNRNSTEGNEGNKDGSPLRSLRWLLFKTSAHNTHHARHGDWKRSAMPPLAAAH